MGHVARNGLGFGAAEIGLTAELTQASHSKDLLKELQQPLPNDRPSRHVAFDAWRAAESAPDLSRKKLDPHKLSGLPACAYGVSLAQ